jgi:hypothetical protein
MTYHAARNEMKGEGPMNDTALFVTPNIHLAATILAKSLETSATLVKQGNLVSFAFPKTKEVMEVVAGFNADTITVPAFSYAEILKRLRAEMYQAKGA